MLFCVVLCGLATYSVNGVESAQVFQDVHRGNDTYTWFQTVSIFRFFGEDDNVARLHISHNQVTWLLCHLNFYRYT